MRQRNDSGHVQDVMAWPTDDHPELRPFTAGPGEVKDHPVLLSGFTLLDPPPTDEPDERDQGSDSEDAAPESGQDAEAAVPETTARGGRSRTKSAAPAAEGSER